jgi:hypothetical protein
MDHRIRELQRLAAGGDEIARQHLIQHYGRAGLVPTDEHILRMTPCGFAIGWANDGAVRVTIEFLSSLLRRMLQNAKEYYTQTILRTEHLFPADEVEESINHFNAQVNQLRHRIDQGLGRAISIHDIRHACSPIINYLNTYIRDVNMTQDEEIPPLYFRYNDVTGALLIGYINQGFYPSHSHARLMKLLITIRETKRDLQAEVMWNVGSTRSGQVDYPDLVKRFSLFGGLPGILQDQPGVWSQYGYGKCSGPRTDYGRPEYTPLTEDLADPWVWIKG